MARARHRRWVALGAAVALLAGGGVVSQLVGPEPDPSGVRASAAGDAAVTLTPGVLPAGALEIRQISVRGSGGTVYLHQGEARPIRVEGDRTRVAGAVSGGQLSLLISPPPGAGDERLDVHLWAPAWATVKVAGATTVTSAEPLDVDQLSLGLSGSARAELLVRGGGLTTSLRGSSEATLRGAVERHDARASGASRLVAGALGTRETSLAAVGTSEATVAATESLDVRNDGVGVVTYVGAPTAITRAGQGTIRPAD